MADEIRATPQSPALGAIARALRKAQEFAGQYEVDKRVPLLGGTSVDELLSLPGAASLMEDISYDGLRRLIRGGNVATGGIGTYKLDPRVADLVDVAGSAGSLAGLGLKAAKPVGKLAAEGIARSVERGSPLTALAQPMHVMERKYSGWPTNTEDLARKWSYRKGTYIADFPVNKITDDLGIERANYYRATVAVPSREGIFGKIEAETDEWPWEFRFENISSGYGDESGSLYGVTGTGHQFEVIKKVSDLFKSFISSQPKKIVYYSAEEPSRARLYERMTRKIEPMTSGAYKGFKFTIPGDEKSYFAAIEKSKSADFINALRSADIDAQKLSDRTKRSSRRDIQTSVETEKPFARGGLVSSGYDPERIQRMADDLLANEGKELNMAGGGLARILKGLTKADDVVEAAAKAAQKEPALPLVLPREPNVTNQDLIRAAERVARQQTGEHVRQSSTQAANLAGRSMKEADRLKRLNVELEPTRSPTPTPVVSEKKGEVRIALPGDISIADQMLMEVEGLPIGSLQQGGPMYGFGKMGQENPAFWASNYMPASNLQKKVVLLADKYDTPDILAMHLAMGHDAMNFGQHFADANLRAIQSSLVHPKAAETFNEIIRKGTRDNKGRPITFEDFPGIENYEESYKAMRRNPEMRKWFNNRMKTAKVTKPLGLPDGKEIEYAIMEPALRNMEPNLVGMSVGRMNPAGAVRPQSTHKTYSHDIPGLALGKTQELIPMELAFPDAYAFIKATKRPQDITGTMQKVFPHQVVDEQYINQLGEYYNQLKKLRGFKKGGVVEYDPARIEQMADDLLAA